MTDLATLTADAGRIEADARHEQALAVLQAWEGYKQRVAEADRFVRAQLLAWCEANGRLDVGDGTFYVAKVPTDRPCADKAAALDALLEAVGGDVRALADCVASDGLKHGAAGKLLPPDVYDRMFPKRAKPTLQKGGKALVKVDTRFIEQAK